MKKICVGLAIFLLLIPGLFAPIGFAEPLPKSSNVLSVEAPRKIKAGSPFCVKVTVNKDAFIDRSSVSVWFETSDPDVNLPHPFIFKKSSPLSRTFTFVDDRAERLEIKVFVISDPAKFSKTVVSVLPSEPFRIDVEPKTVAIQVGQEKSITVNLTDKYGNNIENSNVKWSVYSENGGKVTVKNGVIKGINPGRCIVMAETGKIKDVCSVDVRKSLIKKLKVNLYPDSVNSYPSYTITFVNKNSVIKKGSPLYIIFTDQFMFPCTCHKKIASSEVSIDGISCLKNPKIFYEPRAMEIFSPKKILPNDRVVIKISSSAQIKTPPRIGNFPIGIAFSLDEIPVRSYVNIKFDGLYNFRANPIPNTSGVFSKWVISFYLGKAFSIRIGDSLVLLFPEQFKLPKDIDTNCITLNGKSVKPNSVSVNNSLNFIKILSPTTVPCGSKVVLTIEKSAGIRNPYEAGKYKLNIVSPGCICPIYSESFTINFAPIIDLKYTVSGNKVSGNLFNTEVKISIESFSNIMGDKVKIFYSVNEKNYKIYSKELKFLDGNYKLTFFGKSLYGIATKNYSLQFKIDSTPPSIQLNNVTQGEVSHSKYFLVSGYVKRDPKVLYINGIETPFSANGKFEQMIILRRGRNDIKITAEDYAKNIAVVTITVFYEPEPQFLKVFMSKDVKFGVTTSDTVNLKIVTNKHSLITILSNEDVEVFKMNKTNVLYYRVPISMGSNSIKVCSENEDNQSVCKVINIERVSRFVEINLKIGKLSVFGKNNSCISQNCNVQIIKNRSFIPLSLFSLIIGENLKLSETMHTVYGKGIVINLADNKLIVKGKIYRITDENMPFYEGSEIMLPLRFVLEKIGYVVKWIPYSKIIIIYQREV